MTQRKTAVVIGGGAAGFFGAIHCAQEAPEARVILLEKTKQILTKVKISGGGRCNVTHSCFEPSQLIQNYPRGSKELRGPFTRFQPRDTIQWFEERGVLLKTESDGRMFPITDNSETIVKCLMGEAERLGVEVMRERGVVDCIKEGDRFVLNLTNGESLQADKLLIATGGISRSPSWLEKLGHTLIPPVPSLFTFNIPHFALTELAGIANPITRVSIEGTSLESLGPLLITHWGFSGPAVLRLSAWGARVLHDMGYKAVVKVNWLPNETDQTLKETMLNYRKSHPSRYVMSESPFELPKNLWKGLLGMVQIPLELRWAVMTKEQMQTISKAMLASCFNMEGKSVHKEEFVTCGGVKLQEVNFKTMESLVCPGLYFAGEVLDIDGITGGFNFQAAWTTSFIAGNAMAEHLV